MKDIAKFLAKKTYKYRCAFLSENFCPDLFIYNEHTGRLGAFNKILWDYLPFFDKEVITILGKSIGAIAKKKKASLIVGMESAGIGLAASAGVFCGIPWTYARKQPKGHGPAMDVEGIRTIKGKVLIVDNFVFTGNTLVALYDRFQKLNVSIAGVVGVDFCENIPKHKKFHTLDFEYIIKNEDKIYELLKLNYFAQDLIKYIMLYMDQPSLFISPSSTHIDYCRHLKRYRHESYVFETGKKNIRDRLKNLI